MKLNLKSYINFDSFGKECGKIKESKRTSKDQPFIIKEVYPDGMTEEQYDAELRKRARHFALLFLKIYPDVLSTDEERQAA